MKITDVNIWFSAYPLQRPLHMSSGIIRSVPQVFVKIQAVSGKKTVVGLGHNSYSPLWADRRIIPYKEKERQIRHAILAIKTRLKSSSFKHPINFYEKFVFGDPGQIPRLAYVMAFSPFDLALWDAYAKLQKKHIFALPEVKKRMSADTKGFLEVTHLVDIDASLRSVADTAKKEGMTSYKIKLRGEPVLDAERINSFAEMGFVRTILADANEAYTSEKKLRQWLGMLSIESERKIFFLEQPFPRNSRKRLPAIKNIVFAADESYANHRDIEKIWNMGYRGVALKPHTKTFSGTLLTLDAIKKRNMSFGIMDLTTAPPIGYFVGALTAAHLPTAGPLELNGRQFYRNWGKLVDRGFKNRRDAFLCRKDKIKIACDYAKPGWGIGESEFDAYINGR